MSHQDTTQNDLTDDLTDHDSTDHDSTDHSVADRLTTTREPGETSAHDIDPAGPDPAGPDPLGPDTAGLADAPDPAGDLDRLDGPDEVPGATSEDSGTAQISDSGDARPPANGSRLRVLEREGEVAADFLERLLDIADLDGDIEVDIDGDRAAVAIVDSDEGRVPRRLVGGDGLVLDALQELTRLAVQAETGERSRLMLDVAGHRTERRKVVVETVRAVIVDVQASGTAVALAPMPAFERKIAHDEVAAAGLMSQSEGVEPHRHLIVSPA